MSVLLFSCYFSFYIYFVCIRHVYVNSIYAFYTVTMLKRQNSSFLFYCVQQISAFYIYYGFCISYMCDESFQKVLCLSWKYAKKFLRLLNLTDIEVECIQYRVLIWYKLHADISIYRKYVRFYKRWERCAVHMH